MAASFSGEGRIGRITRTAFAFARTWAADTGAATPDSSIRAVRHAKAMRDPIRLLASIYFPLAPLVTGSGNETKLCRFPQVFSLKSLIPGAFGQVNTLDRLQYYSFSP